MFSCNYTSYMSHDPLDITHTCWFAAQKTFNIIINKKTAKYFCWNSNNFFQDSVESLKEQHLFEIEIVCNILNQFNVTLLDKVFL